VCEQTGEFLVSEVTFHEFFQMKWSEHIWSPTGTPLFIRNWTEGSTSFQFVRTVPLKHAKALSKKPGHLYKL
jgi:hypothetical protein